MSNSANEAAIGVIPHPATAALPATPTVRRIALKDVRDALTEGLNDFQAAPTHLAFLCLIYPVMGLVLARIASGSGALPLIYPLIAGFALLGPIAAMGVYELSWRREQGLDVSARHMLDVRRSRGFPALVVLSALLAVIFLVWLKVALVIADITLPGNATMSLGTFAQAVLTTGGGWAMIILGSAVGFVFALVVLTFSVVSFPLLLAGIPNANIEQQLVIALRTSLRSVLVNPVPMLAWGLIIAVGLALGSLPLLIGLALVMPIFGHATWHLFRKVVA